MYSRDAIFLILPKRKARETATDMAADETKISGAWSKKVFGNQRLLTPNFSKKLGIKSGILTDFAVYE